MAVGIRQVRAEVRLKTMVRSRLGLARVRYL